MWLCETLPNKYILVAAVVIVGAKEMGRLVKASKSLQEKLGPTPGSWAAAADALVLPLA